MTIKDFNLLQIDMLDGEKVIYSGMCSDAPDDIKNKQIEIVGMDGKKMIVKVREEK